MIIDGFLPSSEQKVSIYDNDSYDILFDDAICTALSVDSNSIVMSHPLEDGSKVSDHQVFDLTKISMELNLSKRDYNLVYENIDTAYRSSTLLTIQTKVNIYKNMIIESSPHVEGNYQGIKMNLKLVEFDPVSSVDIQYKPQLASDNNTTKKGIQNGTKVADIKRVSVINKIIGVA
jgi:hypothetical protein